MYKVDHFDVKLGGGKWVATVSVHGSLLIVVWWYWRENIYHIFGFWLLVFGFLASLFWLFLLWSHCNYKNAWVLVHCTSWHMHGSSGCLIWNSIWCITSLAKQERNTFPSTKPQTRLYHPIIQSIIINLYIIWVLCSKVRTHGWIKSKFMNPTNDELIISNVIRD